ncbi:hypothetical protein HA466_0290280 [Hirschfeldia incana]|nr:hypothetical protein HA466_0290280 [Hirschfeldia incana]
MAKVCETCGDQGWEEALVFCDSCKLGAVHRYCCGITPVPIDGYVTWFCSGCDESDSASDSSRQVELDEVESVDVSTSPPETREVPGSSKSNELTGDVSEKTKKRKKKKRKRMIVTHSLPDATAVETMEVSKKKQDGSETGKSDELVGLERNESSVLEKSGRKKKKKTDKGEEKKHEERSNNNHFSPVPEAEGHKLQQATTRVEPVKESKKRKCSESKGSEGLNEVSVLENSGKKKRNGESSTHTSPVLDTHDHMLQDVTSVEAMKESTMPLNQVSVVEKSAKKKKKKKRSEESRDHTSSVLKAVDSGHQDTTNVEAMKEPKKHKTSASRDSNEMVGSARNEVSVLEKSDKTKKKNKTNEESSNPTAAVLAAKDSVACDTDNVEPAKAQESSASRKPTELAGLETNGASVSEGGNSTNVPDHTSCTNSKKRRLSSDNMQVTSVNMELPANNISCKEAESNMPPTNELIPALSNGRAQPFSEPVWRGSVTVKQGKVCRDHGLVAHLSTFASHRVLEKARSFRTRLSAEMFPRLEIWPPSFLKNGPPTDESIALYFFPSRDSNGEKVYYSLVDEMKKKDLAIRCLLDDVELLLFTSYQLPLPLWKFKSKEYLWGVFRRWKTSGH